MKLLRSDRRRAFCSWGFWAGVIGTMLVLVTGSMGSILDAFGQDNSGLAFSFHAQAILSGLCSDIMLFSAPILCALPFTAAFVDDFKSGYIRQSLPRCGKKAYIQSKIRITLLSGALVLFIGIMATYLLYALIFTPMELAPQVQQTAITGKGMLLAPMGNDSQPSAFSQVMGKALMFFLCGGLWSLAGALLASVTMSKYMAYASPFIFYYVLVILCDRYMQNLYVLNPQEWLNAQNFWPGGTWGIALFLTELIVLLSLGYSFFVSKRLSHV